MLKEDSVWHASVFKTSVSTRACPFSKSAFSPIWACHLPPPLTPPFVLLLPFSNLLPSLTPSLLLSLSILSPSLSIFVFVLSFFLFPSLSLYISISPSFPPLSVCMNVCMYVCVHIYIDVYPCRQADSGTTFLPFLILLSCEVTSRTAQQKT